MGGGWGERGSGVRVSWASEGLIAGAPPSSSTVALQALRQKKVYENELDSIAGRKLTLETQVRVPQSARTARPGASHADDWSANGSLGVD